MRQAVTRLVGEGRRWRGVTAATLLLGALWALSWGVLDAGAVEETCTPTCVILIQVDGLEPKDVTQATTPYMWSLAHPPTPGVPGSALNERSGWIWQAPRGMASAGTAPATASLLTGAYPEKTGITGDDFYGSSPDHGNFAHQRLGARGFGDTPDAAADDPDVAQPVSGPAVDTVINVIGKQLGRNPAVFLGDPGLAELTGVTSEESALPRWYPPGDKDSATFPEQHLTGDPRLCPIPRYPDRGHDLREQQPVKDGYDPSFCPANDMTTMHKAISDLAKQEAGFTFIHLAEYGAAKRLAGDPDVDKSDPTADRSTAPPQPAQALANADGALFSFVERYATDHRDTWSRTVMMIVGTHGYQTTPLSNRIPDPGDPTAPLPTDQPAAVIADPTRDLSDFVANYNDGSVAQGSLRLVPQGTMATIHYVGQDPGGRANALQAIKTELEDPGMDAACRQRNPSPALADCIRDVYYVAKDAPAAADTVGANHPTWRLDAHDPKTGARTRAGGDLLVVFGRGWASGRAVGMTYQTGSGKAVTNPYTASAGGPQERAVATLVNGPARSTDPGAVRNLDTFARSGTLNQLKYYPLSKTTVDPSDNERPPEVPAADQQRCPDTNTDPGGLGCANDPTAVPDDAEDAGHEAQPVTVDLAITISALMKLPFDSYPDQLQGRVLQEAFVNKLTPPCVSDCEPPPPPQCHDVASLTQAGEPVAVAFSCVDAGGAPLTYRIVSGPSQGTLAAVDNDTVTYTAPGGFSGNDTFTYQATSKNGTSEVATATVVVMEPPVVIKPKGFDFEGLMRKLTARVVDARGRPYSRARRGAVLSRVNVEADFGKPESAVTLTFYRRDAAARRRGARGARVIRLKPIARFDPFVVKRGHVTMKLKLPKLFKPTYIGVTVREIARTGNGRRRLSGGQPCTTLRTRKPVPFRCTGPSRGVIVGISDAGRLHKRKGIAPRAPRRRR